MPDRFASEGGEGGVLGVGRLGRAGVVLACATCVAASLPKGMARLQSIGEPGWGVCRCAGPCRSSMQTVGRARAMACMFGLGLEARGAQVESVFGGIGVLLFGRRADRSIGQQPWLRVRPRPRLRF
jgi:hypothetical protein